MGTPSVRFPGQWKWVWFLFTWLPFGLLPLCLFFLLTDHALTLAETEHLQSLARSHERMFHLVHEEVAPKGYCGRRFAAFQRAVRKNPDPAALPALLERSRRLSPIRFDPYLFDEKGRLVTPAAIPTANRFVAQRLWDFLQADPQEAQSLRNRLGKLFHLQFGAEINLPAFRDAENRLLEIRTRNRDGFLQWIRLGKDTRAGLLLVAWQLPPRLRRLAGFGRTLAANEMFLLVPHLEGRWQWFGRKPLPGLIADLRRLRLSGETTLLSGRQFLWRVEAEGRAYVLGRPLPGGWLYDTWRSWLYGLFVALAVLSCGVFGAGTLSRGGVRHPIRLRLVALFLFSLSIPSGGVAFLGSRLQDDRREVLRAEVERQARKELNTLDSHFQTSQNLLLARCREIHDAVRRGTPLSEMQASLTHLLQRDELRHFDIRNLAGDAILTPGIHLRMEGLEYFFESFARVCMERRLKSRLESPEGSAFRNADAMAEDIISAGEIGVGGIAAAPDMIHQFKLGDSSVFWYWNVIAEPNHPAAFTILVQSIPAEERAFLVNQLGPSAGKGAGRRIFAFSQTADDYFPPRIRPGLELRALAEQVRLSGQPVRARLHWGGRSWLAVGQPGKYIHDYILFALLPEDAIDRAVGFLRGGLAVCLGAALLVGLLLGSELAIYFLHPINDLGRGMLALQRRDVTFRVPVHSADEFGELARTFNWMIEDLKEMELARIVQASLIPQEMPAIRGFRLAMRNFVATDLGGDYCDVLPLPDGRFLVVIGDVTGHGVGAALGMTLVKTIIFQYAQEGGPLTTLLERLNRVVLQAFQRRKQMTLLAAVLDPDAGTFQFANAGHIYPLLLPANRETPRELVQINFLLGVRDRKFTPRDETFTLQPGDRIFLCTDGLIEGTDPQEEQFGYDRVREFLFTADQTSVEKQCDELLEVFFAFHRGRILADDLTMLMIQRTAEEQG